MKAAETLRAREVYRYFQPGNEILPRDATVPIIATPLGGPAIPTTTTTFQATNFDTQQSFSDTALTAFVQLIALRLQCQRAIVSLIDHENEYFLAESTSTLSLLNGEGPTQNASLSISGARVPRSASLCEETLRLVPNQQTSAEMTPVCFVPDLRLDERMKHLECVQGEPHLRFYSGVALTNQVGFVLGAVYVVDDRPRSHFSIEEAQFLTKMAATVMDHLENIRAKEDIVRVTRMSQALHAFIEGDGTMDGDWQRLKKYNLPTGDVGFHWESNKQDGSGLYVNGKKELGSDIPESSGSTLNVPVVGKALDQGQSPLQHSSPSHDARFDFNSSPWNSSTTVPQVPPLKSVFDGIDDATTTLTGGRDIEFLKSGFSNLLHATFSRASNLVREGMEIDGAVFFDAPFDFYQGRSTLETDPRPRHHDVPETRDESDSDDLNIRPGPRPISSPSKHHRSYRHTHGDHEKPVPMGLKSEILGFSTSDTSSWNNQNANSGSSFTSIDQSLLTSLVRRYPQGELFVFDEYGPIEPHSSTLAATTSHSMMISSFVEEKRARRQARKRVAMLRLLVAFPGARQIFFVPLYDSTSGCFIGSFAWSTSATRIFSTENHLSYLVAFGHSVMSEVSRLNTLSADRAKGDFISNVSHELRSPLHGILASVEFLADSALDGFQRNLVDTVDMCGRTLLDTIEHVLDFSKIKKFGHDVMQPLGVVADLDVSAVIEEVLEGCYAGFEFNGLSSQGLADTTQSRTRDVAFIVGTTSSPSDELQSAFSNDLLTVILDIDFRDQWKFPTVPGTWRRLTMNLFGNSLKYTKSGYIKIKLEAQPIPNTNLVVEEAAEKTMVILTVSDSGRGISPGFLKTKLFMPFSQEDVTFPGTGLGMSIVKQIVDLSGGRIDIRSELGKGTEVKLSLPLDNCLSDAGDSPAKLNLLYTNEGPVDAVRRRAKGRTVQIRGFDASTFGDSELQTSSLASLKASIEKYVSDWFNLEIVSEDQPPDIVISDESAFLKSSSVTGSKFRSLLIICSNGARRDFYNKSHLKLGQTVEFVSKPCGPHRCAKALLNCLDAEDVLQKASDEKRSSIGFSPKAINLKDSPTVLSARPRTPSHRVSFSKPNKPHVPETIYSGVIATESSESSSPNNNTSEESSGDSSISSAAFLSEASPSLELGTQDGSNAPRKPKMLLVEDNPVNMMLLATYMKKNGWEYEKATNGLIAMQVFQSRPEGFDVIFMGYEATRAIRSIELERKTAYTKQQALSSPLVSPLLTTATLLSTSFPFKGPPTPLLRIPTVSCTQSQSIELHLNASELILSRPALIIALTGFSSQQDQETAFESGVDIFMTKPVRFREVGRILDGWIKKRKREAMGIEDDEFGAEREVIV
ncbi:Hybrid signal transduction dokA [Hyphodiscus hymeniophilus]|uniref:histidine kinase n=1 Tax=Hyphodiscus hymeniophilus TaxID=353542 RepID=A0A9P6VG77_9HELO|nr:Hybrid signal transduction dokA [Hyphodiscus hymeniophilus]